MNDSFNFSRPPFSQWVHCRYTFNSNRKRRRVHYLDAQLLPYTTHVRRTPCAVSFSLRENLKGAWSHRGIHVGDDARAINCLGLDHLFPFLWGQIPARSVAFVGQGNGERAGRQWWLCYSGIMGTAYRSFVPRECLQSNRQGAMLYLSVSWLCLTMFCGFIVQGRTRIGI